ncbi:hypothetical protein HNQ96_004561 [Aminobacter lissarensis]|uniref:Uncharacterized protein n=1 Tax=Aminobacter carboxidus TaxID=376165 RepID=A0A8E1WHK8_9HYPH|nr:hypothetical protein [Aminobacter lissarensis]
MKLRFLFALFLINAGLIFSFQQAAHAACVVPSYNQKRGIPPGFAEAQGFKGRFDFPASTSEPLPAFLSIDFTQDWRAYIQAVLDYSLEGNIAVDFNVANNNVRNWYHALWMHPGNSGREFLHGLTKERATDPEQLAEGVTKSFDTWAVGFYNALGATTFAKVWSDPCSPRIDDIYFPIGTTSFKLLFTTATAADIPYVAGAPEWDGDIGRAPNRIGKLRLYQIDIAVRDPRSLQTGWVFGTFVYQGTEPGTDPWKKLVPVGLSWGNDRFVRRRGNCARTCSTKRSKARSTAGQRARSLAGAGASTGRPTTRSARACPATVRRNIRAATISATCHGNRQRRSITNADCWSIFATSSPAVCSTVSHATSARKRRCSRGRSTTRCNCRPASNACARRSPPARHRSTTARFPSRRFAPRLLPSWQADRKVSRPGRRLPTATTRSTPCWSLSGRAGR